MGVMAPAPAFTAMIYVTCRNDFKNIGILNTFLKLKLRQNACSLNIHNLSTNTAASGASRCSAPQPGTVYLRYEHPNCRWAASSAYWRLSFSSTREPSSGAVVT